MKSDQFKFPETSFGCCRDCRTEVREQWRILGRDLWPSEEGEWSDLGCNLVTGVANVLMREREESRIPLGSWSTSRFFSFVLFCFWFIVLFLGFGFLFGFFFVCFVFVFLKLISWRRSART